MRNAKGDATSAKLKAQMAYVPPNLGAGPANAEPPVELNPLGADGQPDHANLAEANGPDRRGLFGNRDRARWFRPRHVQMMALGISLQFEIDHPGSSIATGLFFQTGKMLFFSGPVSMLLAFLLIGTLNYAVLVLFCGGKSELTP